jgi:hypothetical protein
MLETVGKLPKLRTLRFGAIEEITGNGFKNLKNCDQLEELILPIGLDSASLDFLGSLESLRSLELSGFTITDSAMVHVAKAKNLRSLKLTNTMVRGTTFSELKNLHQLSFIHFNRNNFTSDLAVEQLIKLPGLRRFYSEWTPFTDRSLELVLKSESIESVELRYGLLTQEGIAKFNSTKKKGQHREPMFVPESEEHVKALQRLLDKGAGMYPNIGFTARDGTHQRLVQIHLIEGVWAGTDEDLKYLKKIPHMIVSTNLKKPGNLVQVIKEINEQVYMFACTEGFLSADELRELKKLLGEKRVRILVWDPKLGWRRQK